MSSDLCFVSPSIHSFTSSSPPPHVWTLTSFASISSMLDEPQEKQDGSYQPKSYTGTYTMSARTMNQVTTQCLIKTATSPDFKVFYYKYHANFKINKCCQNLIKRFTLNIGPSASE